MTAYRFLASRGALARTRLAARARQDRGDTLIEVLVAALLVALIAGAVLTGFVSVAHLSGDQRKHAQADSLAQQDAQRMRGLTITQLGANGTNSGNWSRTVGPIDGTTFTIASTASSISGTGASSCVAGSASTSADEVATTSSVSWTPTNGRPPVVVHGLVAPGIGGSLIATVTTLDSTGATAGLAGVTVAISGPSSVPSLVTDADGCAVFAGLTGGSYTVTMTPPTGYVDVNGGTTIASQVKTVTPALTANASAGPLAQPGTVNATFTTAFNGTSNVAAKADQMTFVQQGMLPPYRTFGTDSTAANSTFVSSMTTGATMFPFATAYAAFAGGCNNPPPVGQAGLVSVPVSAAGTTNVVLPEPAMIILPYTPTTVNVDDPVGSGITYAGTWTHATNVTGDYLKTESRSSSTSASATYTFNGPGISIVSPTGPTLGQFNVKLDGVSQGTIDLYTKNAAQQQTVWTSATLSPTITHTLIITPLGTKNSKSSSTTITIDELIATGLQLMTTKPNVTITDTDAACANNEDYPPEQVPTATGGALASPGIPYGTYTICVDNGSNHDTVTGFANTNYGSTGNIANAFLYTGATGYGSGVCT